MQEIITPLMEVVSTVAGLELNMSFAGVGLFATLGSLATLGITYEFIWKPYVGKWLGGLWEKIKTL